MTVRGKEALKLLLDSHQFSDVITHAMQADSIHQLTPQLSKTIRKLVSDECTLSFLVPVNRYPGSRDDGEMADESDGSDGGVQLKALIGGILVFCDPHVVSGVCCLVHNIFLAFPDYMTAYLHPPSLLAQLTRCSLQAVFVIINEPASYSSALVHSRNCWYIL